MTKQWLKRLERAFVVLALGVTVGHFTVGNAAGQQQPQHQDILNAVVGVQSTANTINTTATTINTTVNTINTKVDSIEGKLDSGPMRISACMTITTSGSYVLTQNLSAIGTCITILTDFVTIDLSGHTLTGDGTGEGISDGGAVRLGISIYNGTITNFNHGIDLRMSTDSEVRKIRAVANGQDGIRVGHRNTVSDNIANSNGNNGIEANQANTISHNTAGSNVGSGIAAAGFGNTISHNTAGSNGGSGIAATGVGNTITNNTAGNNGGFGIGATTGTTISHNTAFSNGAGGIVTGGALGFGNTISHNTAGSNVGSGIEATCPVGRVSNIFGNTAQGNAPNGLVAGCQLFNNVGF